MRTRHPDGDYLFIIVGYSLFLVDIQSGKGPDLNKIMILQPLEVYYQKKKSMSYFKPIVHTEGLVFPLIISPNHNFLETCHDDFYLKQLARYCDILT